MGSAQSEQSYHGAEGAFSLVLLSLSLRTHTHQQGATLSVCLCVWDMFRGWRARYNPHYDSLILVQFLTPPHPQPHPTPPQPHPPIHLSSSQSSGTDGAVNLWHVPRAEDRSHTPAVGAGDEKGSMRVGVSPKSLLEDPAQTFTEHEDSVYGNRVGLPGWATRLCGLRDVLTRPRVVGCRYWLESD